MNIYFMKKLTKFPGSALKSATVITELVSCEVKVSALCHSIKLCLLLLKPVTSHFKYKIEVKGICKVGKRKLSYVLGADVPGVETTLGCSICFQILY